MNTACDYQPPSHFEYYAKVEFDLFERVKQRAFAAMLELDGWCPQLKASMLIDLILINEPEVIVEIGVFGGMSLIPMAFAVKENGVGKVYGIDPWDSNISVQGMDEINGNWWGSVDHQAVLDKLVKKIRRFKLEEQIELIRDTSANASPIYNIDVLHIDGNHSEDMAYLDATTWVPRVKKGGFIIFDDPNWPTTKKAVDWINENCLKVTEYQDDHVAWIIWMKPN